jgi:hypothetical protein
MENILAFSIKVNMQVAYELAYSSFVSVPKE